MDRARLLVSLLSGFPFPPGAARILEVDTRARTWTTTLGGLTMLVDFEVVTGGRTSTIYTVEFSTNLLGGGPGRLQRHAAGTATVIADNPVTPTSVAVGRDSLCITELGTGRILRFQLP